MASGLDIGRRMDETRWGRASPESSTCANSRSYQNRLSLKKVRLPGHLRLSCPNSSPLPRHCLGKILTRAWRIELGNSDESYKVPPSVLFEEQFEIPKPCWRCLTTMLMGGSTLTTIDCGYPGPMFVRNQTSLE